MPTITSSQLRFSSYWPKNGAAEIYLPGHQSQQVTAEIILPGEDDPRTVALKKSSHPQTGEFYWVSDKPVPLGSKYRFKINGKPSLDWLEVNHTKKHGAFNQISTMEESAPRKSVVMADIYQNSLRSKDVFKALDQNQSTEPHVPMVPMQNHFEIKPAGDKAGNEAGLNELMPHLRDAGFSSVLLKPFIGGDDLSSHRYWTTDPFALNDSFKNKQAFRNSLNLMLSNGMKVFADGAFVNQGLNGVQMMSNLTHGFSSPYWKWFKDVDNTHPIGPTRFPSHAYEKFVFGILPTRLDESGHREIDYDRFAFRFDNDPREPGYKPNRPVFLELYDPRVENKDGSLIRGGGKNIKASMDSVQKYRFPVPAKALEEKRQQLSGGSNAEKKAFSEWENFRLEKASHDDSSVKWDGQVDVALMDTRNPEVVSYLDGAVGYWSRMVMNTYTHEVAGKLAEAKRKLPGGTPREWLNAITQLNAQDLHPDKILPPVTQPEADVLLDEEILRATRKVPPDLQSHKMGSAFSKRLLDEIPMSVLTLPPLFKANLTYPDFVQSLRKQSSTGFSRFFIKNVLNPLAQIPWVGKLFSALRNMLLPPSFQNKLGGKLQKIFQELEPELQRKIRYGRIQSILADRLGERLYLSLLTNRSLTEVRKMESNPEQIADALYSSLPDVVLKADPVTVSKILPGILKKRLDKISEAQLASQIKEEVDHLEPELVELANTVLQKREFGLNWRIDAAKDVADIDSVRRAEPHEKPELFKAQISFIKDFWSKLGNTMRTPFSKASVIAELTDFPELANDEALAKQAMSSLFEKSTFTSTPNMRYLYSPPMELLNYAQRPDEHGAWQLRPSQFLNEVVKPMSQSVPFPALKQYQNLVSSHDYTTASHAFLVNPELFNMDRLKSWGLKDDFIVASSELENKACFAVERQKLATEMGVDAKELPIILHALRAWLDQSGGAFIKPRLKEKGMSHLKGYFDADEKLKDPQQKKTNNGPTPFEYKRDFVKGLFSVLPSEARKNAEHPLAPLKDLNEQALNALQKALTSRMSERSEAKAMRGVIVNAVESLDWTALQKQIPALNPVQIPAIKAELWTALDGAIQQWGQHFGYQPLDIALNHVFEKLDGSGMLHKNPPLREALKLSLYRDATSPVMEKMQRLFALQNALPGNPSVYLPDLFAQGGSEWTKNIFVQNRNTIRVDKLENDPQFQAFYQQVGQIFKTRQSLPVLNNGVVLPVEVDDEKGILPIIRDNGAEQAIVLLNTGKPQPLEEHDGKAGFSQATYPTIQLEQPVASLEGLKLNSPYLEEGTRYQDINSKRIYSLNAEKALIPENPFEGQQTSFKTQLVLKRI